MEQIVELLVNCDQNHVSTPLLTIKLETLTHFLTISDTFAHQTSTPTWKKIVILNQI
jgi:hypothetical protein